MTNFVRARRGGKNGQDLSIGPPTIANQPSAKGNQLKIDPVFSVLSLRVRLLPWERLYATQSIARWNSEGQKDETSRLGDGGWAEEIADTDCV